MCRRPTVPQLLPNLTPAQQQQLEGFLNNNFAYELDLNSMAYQAQGVESEVEYGLGKNIFVRGGYTYLDAVVQRSFSSDAIGPGTNPKLSGDSDRQLFAAGGGKAVPASSAHRIRERDLHREEMVGGPQRGVREPQRRLHLSGRRRRERREHVAVAESQSGFFLHEIDLGTTYQWKPWMAVYTQLDNLTSNQHIGPIGYPSMPF